MSSGFTHLTLNMLPCRSKKVSEKKDLNTPTLILWDANTKEDEKPDQHIETLGFHATEDLKKAMTSCRAQVEQISQECRKKNRRYRDIEFDLQNDAYRCLNTFWGAYLREPTGVQRVAEIFDKPGFFKKDGAPSSEDIIQGDIGDCWFLAALAAISAVPGLLEEICTARDEEVGVYGFVFHRDNGWKAVIIDDFLFTNTPKYEELTEEEKRLYHFDKDEYTRLSKGGKGSLTYAKSGAQGETWVPLIEKAYAKFYGNYDHLNGGWTGEAIEDLTGSFNLASLTCDILDLERFWTEELLKVNKDRVFSCSFNELSNKRNGKDDVRVQGLVGQHAYSVLRAKDYNGKRFLVIRNPWGESEWNGPWSDGSKEWTPEWHKLLIVLEHQFGDDGQFVMEYSDFLKCFQVVERTILLDNRWNLSSKWFQVPLPPPPAPWSYGDISYEFEIPEATRAVVVLSQLNQRFFQTIANLVTGFTLDFVMVKAGETKALDHACPDRPFCQSVSLELDLGPGKYRVYPRIDRYKYQEVDFDTAEALPWLFDWGWDGPEWVDQRELSRFIMSKIEANRVASNATNPTSKFTSLSLADVISRDETGETLNQKEKMTFLSRAFRHVTFKNSKSRKSAFGAFSSIEPYDIYQGLFQSDEPIVGLKVRFSGDGSYSR
ncbi:cysteine proteinase [Coprinopsis marcescibilis]|uniref:Cysteine proteinase n=1 Tax=Coprinopsis marcescibilis TaxID=230819 RepID=A0A5C3KVA6_COPMA|nr:cysteine proteinase [Coprinopsis marcescibilis]